MAQRMKIFHAAVAIFCCVGQMAFAATQIETQGNGKEKKIKNIIVMVPDGCNTAIQTLARWYKGQGLMVDSLYVGLCRTWCANSVITGSAAAATAFATGFKTTEPFISVGPRQNDVISAYRYPYPPEILAYRPLATVLEAAKKKGKATGLVATSTVSHATPACYAAHIDNRSNEQGIMEHIVYQNINVVFGGGRNNLTTRTDGENLRDTLISRGYKYVTTRDEMLALSSGNVWGMFAGGSMQPEVDRTEFAPDEPSLAEMTAKAIEILSKHERGFFLFVEGSQTDWAAHNNDPIYLIKDFLAFDDALRVAVEFARRDSQTAIIAFPDHNTGGLSIGSYYSDKKIAYDRMSPEFLVNPLRGMLLSSQGIAAKIANKNDPVQIKDAVQKWWNITLNDADLAEILAWPHSTTFNYKLASVVSKNHTVLGWTSHGHTGEDVPIWYYNANINGLWTIDNTEIAKHIFMLLDVEPFALNNNLFVDVAVSPLNGFWSIDNTDAQNPVLVVKNPSKPRFSARLPISKDEAFITGPNRKKTKHLLDGIVVHAPITNRVYVTQKTIDLILAKYNAF